MFFDLFKKNILKIITVTTTVIYIFKKILLLSFSKIKLLKQINSVLSMYFSVLIRLNFKVSNNMLYKNNKLKKNGQI